jgi:hypothetical protein
MNADLSLYDEGLGSRSDGRAIIFPQSCTYSWQGKRNSITPARLKDIPVKDLLNVVGVHLNSLGGARRGAGGNRVIAVGIRPIRPGDIWGLYRRRATIL